MKRSKFVALLVAGLLVGTLFVGGAAAATSSSEDLPEDAEVGTDFEANFEVEDLFDEFNTWTLAAETELTDVTWTVWQYDPAGSEIDRSETDGQSAAQDVDIDDNVDRIEVRVTGTVPEIENISYDPPHQFSAANFTQERSGGTDRHINDHGVHHYTEESNEARQALDSAREAVNASGSGQDTFESAVSSYENGNFENAISLAESAESDATRSQLIRTGLLAGGAIIVLALLGFGGYRVYQSRKQDTSRLR
ncbi:uncharacterized protein NP_2402A [Natronomonas pharaonis DSM 2160]|uniref:Uncharacterized protein n=1 Tax=Natronomonas pharaonis (strain ATCC 35678 / DSM 2160 / CIP 103997 / JCM 8858 / NBRC 14720 / NCIMB 2260 / Gabara) TaxID=348780 RepID=A0A1U7EW34_NATPD|nr:hypothetical protein [Natronomonas pharaonis]CAI49292.1 uncharacterized protein NP_2402A [Natronomonas pharaonis DSM 2160]